MVFAGKIESEKKKNGICCYTGKIPGVLNGLHEYPLHYNPVNKETGLEYYIILILYAFSK